MSIEGLMTMQGTLVHRSEDGPPGDYNAPTVRETRTPTRCLVQHMGGSEDAFLRTSDATTDFAYLPPGTTVDASDQLIVDGTTYELTAPPRPAYNPRLRRDTHVELELAAIG